MTEPDPNAVPLREYVEAMLRQRDKHIDQAIQAAAIATTKAEAATERRFEGVNEFRAALSDLAALQVPRAEFTLALSQINSKIEDLKIATDTKISDLRGSNRAGASALWGYIVGAGGFLSTIITVVVLLSRSGAN